MRTLSFALLATALALGGCKTVGTDFGSRIGGALGSQVGSGVGSYIAMETGTLLGGVVGGELAALLDEESQRRATEASGTAITTGAPQTWSNPDAGTSGEVTVVKESKQTVPAQVAVLEEAVPEPLPPVDLIGASYVATDQANVRGGPGTDYKAVDSLTKGEAVNVVGKVRGQNWYMVSKGGVVIGYVSTTLLAEQSAPATASTGTTGPKLADHPKPSGTVVTETVTTERTCRTAEHRVTLASGEVVAEAIDGCATPEGWNTTTRPVAPGSTTGARPS